MIAKPAEIEPYIAAYGIDLEVRDVVIQGFDAAIRAAEDPAAAAAPLSAMSSSRTPGAGSWGSDRAR